MRSRRVLILGQRPIGTLSISSGLIAVLLLLVIQPLCRSFTVNPDVDCDGPCTETDRLCRSRDCKHVFDSCPPGTAQGKANVTQKVDYSEDACYWTECGPDSCKAGFMEVTSERCDYNVVKCLREIGCHKEWCCPRKDQYECCPLLACTVAYDGCQVPQQAYLTDPSRTEIEITVVAHNNSASFPFYTVAQLPHPGGDGGSSGSCESVRLWGKCICDDGRKNPGCEATNSSSWFRRVDGVQDNDNAELLPGNLSLTCVVLPAPPTTEPPTPLATPPPTSPATPPPTSPATPPPTPALTLTSGDDVNGSDAGGKDATGQSESASESSPGGERQRPHKRQWLVAVIIIGCLLLAVSTALVVLWCCGMLPDLHTLRIQSLTTYKPVFTGQSYTPHVGGVRNGGNTSYPSSAGGDNIPWNRFLAAARKTIGWLLYGRRYLEESASAATAAERYRTLNSLGRHRRQDDEAGERAALALTDKQPPTPATIMLSVFPSSQHQRATRGDDDLGTDEVFTLEDLGTGSSDPAFGQGGWNQHVGKRLPVSHAASVIATSGQPPLQVAAALRGSSVGASAVSVSLPAGQWAAPPSYGRTGTARVSFPPSSAAAAGSSTTAEGLPLLQMNQLGLSTSAAAADARSGYGSDGYAISGGGVIHTRPLRLSEDGEVPPEVDAPLRWLPSPQITGHEK